MTDLLDAAQKKIDTAAGQLTPSSVSSSTPPPPAPEPVVTPQSAPVAMPADPLPPEPAPTPATVTGTATIKPVDMPKVNADMPPVQPPDSLVVPPPPGQPEQPKKGFNKVLIGAVIAILLVVVPVSAYFISNRNVALTEQRSNAALCCEGGTCANGWTYGRDENTPQVDCATRAAEACSVCQGDNTGCGGPATGGGQCAGGGGTGDPVPGQPCSTPNEIRCFNQFKYWCQPSSNTWSTAGDPCTGSASCTISGYSCSGTQCMAHNALTANGTCGDVLSSQGNCNGGAGCGGSGGTGGSCAGPLSASACSTQNVFGTCLTGTGGAPTHWCLRTTADNCACVEIGAGQTCNNTNSTEFCRNQPVGTSNAGVCTCVLTNPADNQCTCINPNPTSSPTPTGTGGGACAGPAASCETQACCTGQNLLCQGVSGSRRCEVAPAGGYGDIWCTSANPANPGLGCNRYRGHQCTALTGAQCTENGQNFTTWEAAMAYAAATGCGQADVVCNEGDRDGQLCGDFVIYNNSCGTPQSPTVTQPPVSITQPPAGPQCTALFIYDVDGIDITPTLRDGTKRLMPGDTIVIATTKGNSTKARFRFQGITNFEETTQTRTLAGIEQFYVTTTVPSTITTASATIEVEVTIDNITWN